MGGDSNEYAKYVVYMNCFSERRSTMLNKKAIYIKKKCYYFISDYDDCILFCSVDSICRRAKR